MSMVDTSGLPITGQDITIKQGSLWSHKWVWSTTPDGGTTKTPVDLSAYKARMQVRARAQQDPLYVTFSSDAADADRQGTIALGADGSIVVTLDGSHGHLFDGVKKGVYDLSLWSTPGNDATRFCFCEGAVTIDPQVTDSVVGE